MCDGERGQARLRRQVVALEIEGSNPFAHPTSALETDRRDGSVLHKALLYAPVAQWIEHRSSEPRVTGSNPVGRATSPPHNEGLHGLLSGTPCFVAMDGLLTFC